MIANKWIQDTHFVRALAAVVNSVGVCICWSRVSFDVSSDEEAARIKSWIFVPAC